LSEEAAGRCASPIGARVELSHGVLPVGRPGKVYALISLIGKDTGEGKAERLPLNMNMVLDRSGSMGGHPLEQVKQAAQFLVGQLTANDVASLTVFDSLVDVVFPAQHVVNKDLLKSHIEAIWADSMTNLSGGLLRGYEEAFKNNREGQVNRVLLLTDGQANEGITDPEILAAKASSLARKGVSLSTIGVGTDFNEDLLIKLAEAGRGSYYYVRDSEHIPGVFNVELKGLLSVVAQGITLSVEGLSGCKVSAVLGYAPQFTATGATLTLPDMFADEEKQLAVELTFPSLPAGDHPVLRLNLTYADACHNLAQTSFQLVASLSAGIDIAEPQQPNFEVITHVELVRSALLKEESVAAMDRGDYDSFKAGLGHQLERMKTLIADGKVTNPQVLREVEELERMQSRADFLATDAQLRSEARKDLRTQSYQMRYSQAAYIPDPGRSSKPSRKQKDDLDLGDMK
jgi:Ca-activated chloride channel family protein